MSNQSNISEENHTLWVRTGEAAHVLGISRNTLKKLVRQGLLKAYQVKGVTGLQFKREDVLSLLVEVRPEDVDENEDDDGLQ